MKRGTIVIILFLSVVYFAVGQNNYRYPTQYALYFTNYKLINPGIGYLEKVKLAVGNRSMTGDLNNVTSYWASLYIKYNKEDTSRFSHSFGGNFVSDKEGPLFQRSRGYFVYSATLRLNEQVSISSGVSAGFVSFTTQPTVGNNGSGASTYDASWGISLASKRIILGMSLNQMPNNSLTPVQERLILKRYFETHFEYITPICPSFLIKTVFQNSIQKGLDFTPQMGCVAEISDIILVGSMYKLNRQVIFLAGFKNITLIGGKWNALFSYQIPTRTSIGSLVTPIFEFSLGLDY